MDAHDWDERYRAVTEPWGVDPAGTVATRIADLTPGTAIDLACGDGRHARWMAGQGWSVTAVDYSSVAIDLARASDRDNVVDWRVGDATTWQPEGAVDLVLVSFLHLEVDELAETLKRIGEWLTPGGRVLYLGIRSRTSTVVWAVHPNRPFCRYFRSRSRSGGIEGLCPRTCRSATGR